ncbi:MAG TPA: FlgD immunoglobulin-like domain containing protein, partial [bacterium]|nr:FlgD immunoglobulin-like domain containing protein [bacterium]
NGLLYFAAGSWLTPANKFPGAETNYRTASWYGVDVTDWSIKDQIDWTFTPKAKTFADSSNERPRALAFSVTGDTCYLGTFDRGAIQMLVKGEAGPVDVTFRINMHVQEQYGNFNPATDKVVLRGSLNGWAGDADELLPTSEPGVYALTKTFPADQIGTEIEFKYVKQPGDVWENVDNRKLTIPTSSTVLPIVFFNNVETYTEIKTANVTFQADVSDMIAKGFTAGTDELLVLGVFNGWAYNDEWITQPDLVQPTLYTLTHAITDVPGTVMGWKFRGRPEANFADGGWEGGDNHTFTFTGEDLVLDAFKPNVTPAGKKLSQDVTVTFSVNVAGAKDYYNKKEFPTIEKVIINGDFAPIGTGGWAGWSVADIGSTLISMYDDGTNGDVTAGDGIWTCQVLFAAGSTASHYYKYGIYSTGYTDTLNAGTIPMDNEAGFAMNHVITISDANPVFVAPTDKFGSQWTKVERIPTSGLPKDFALSANYPNPFNPTTYITYDLPAKSHVRLTVFNAMGQIVSRLVDKEQTAGSYRVSWNGTNMDGSAAPSGIYFYRLEGDGFAKTMKMTLMK